MNLIETMKQALEALTTPFIGPVSAQLKEEVITNLRTAIAEIEKTEPEWYYGVDSNLCKRFYHRCEVRPSEFNTPLYLHPAPAVSESVKPVAKPFDNWLLGDWFKAKTIDDMEAFYWSRLPAIREAAKVQGYAIGVHGSCRRDFDLMAIPWTDKAAPIDYLAHAIQKAACGITASSYRWEQKPLGRMATSMCICWIDHANPDFKGMVSAGHIDLSVIPRPSPAVPESVEPVAWMITTSNSNLHPLDPNRESNWLTFDLIDFKRNCARSLKVEGSIPLYTAPAVPPYDAEKDAARYRWLRDKHGLWFPPSNDWHGGEDADAAIDAAMKETQ